MFLVRDVFRAKPGQANALVERFAATLPQIRAEKIVSQRVLVDAVATYWTVILETEVEDLDAYFALAENPAAREGMAGYMDYVTGGQREIFKVVTST